jgi:very-short-patch-repair endonuclease
MVARPDFSTTNPSPLDSNALLSVAQVAEFVSFAPAGAVTALGGLDGRRLKTLIDGSQKLLGSRRFLGAPLPATGAALRHVESIMDIMTDAALKQWPTWFTDVSFSMCGNDALGRQAAGVIAREVSARIAGVSAHWTEEAALLALRDRKPRVANTSLAMQLAQLSRAISRDGMVFVAELSEAGDPDGAAQLLHALEWVAIQAQAAVIALFPKLPPIDSPFERILYGARHVQEQEDFPEIGQRDDASAFWMLPWQGAPHPMSVIEQRMAQMLANDTELAGLFHFNWTLTTRRQLRPRVDLVWLEGYLVVELDGYADHSTRRAFIDDRQRDYELTLSGYTVLRLSNDEVTLDYGRALTKIRDLVRLRRQAMTIQRQP